MCLHGDISGKLHRLEGNKEYPDYTIITILIILTNKYKLLMFYHYRIVNDNTVVP